MKKAVSLVMVLLFVMSGLMITACTGGSGSTTSSAQPESGSTPTDSGSENVSLTLKPGVLQVGMEVGYPPMEYLEEDGVTVTGFDFEVATAIAGKLGAELEIVDTAWDAIFSSLGSNRYDIIISSVSITPPRQEAYNMTRPYIANKIVIVAPNGSSVTSPDDLEGIRVATQTETTSDEFMLELMDNGLKPGEYYVYDKIIQCFDELFLNRVDAVVVDSVVAAYYMGEESDKVKIVWENDEAEPLGLCLKKGNDALTAEIERIVDELYADGTMRTLSIKYFGRDVTAGVR